MKSLTDALARCQRQETALRTRTQAVEAIQRLMTVPGIGPLTATMRYAWIGDVRRFPHAKQLAAYAGLIPSVRQSGDTVQLGRITKQGTPLLRATLVQAAHVLLSRCRGPAATPLQAIGGGSDRRAPRRSPDRSGRGSGHAHCSAGTAHDGDTAGASWAGATVMVRRSNTRREASAPLAPRLARQRSRRALRLAVRRARYRRRDIRGPGEFIVRQRTSPRYSWASRR